MSAIRIRNQGDCPIKVNSGVFVKCLETDSIWFVPTYHDFQNEFFYKGDLIAIEFYDESQLQEAYKAAKSGMNVVAFGDSQVSLTESMCVYYDIEYEIKYFSDRFVRDDYLIDMLNDKDIGKGWLDE